MSSYVRTPEHRAKVRATWRRKRGPWQEYVDRYAIPEPNSGCLLWTGRLVQGYGRIRWNGKVSDVHRIVWEQTYGPIPNGGVVGHHCDQPSCLNPRHLFLGTHADNVADRVRKGRSRGGPPGILSIEQVRLIRSAANVRGYARLLATKFGVSISTIYGVRNGQRWSKHN